MCAGATCTDLWVFAVSPLHLIDMHVVIATSTPTDTDIYINMDMDIDVDRCR